MGFNRNDLQGDDDFNFDDDDFKFDDQPGSDDDFKFDDDAPDIDLDNGTDSGFGFESEDMPELNEEGTAPQRTNRTFVYIAALMIILFLLGLGAVLFLATRDTGPSPIDQTRAAIETANADTQILLLQTETAAAVFSNGLTQTALVPTNTPTPTETPTREPTITPTIEATLDATQLAANFLLTQVADQEAQTAQALLTTPTVAAPSGDSVSLTATALVAILGNNNNVGQNLGPSGNNLTATAQVAIIGVPGNDLTATAVATILGTPSNNQTATAVAAVQIIPGDNLTATSLAALLGASSNDVTSTAIAGIFGTPSNGMTATARAILGGFPTQEIAFIPTRLPDTGFFDDVGNGGNVGLIALLALVLVGVIGVSRVVRAANK